MNKESGSSYRCRFALPKHSRSYKRLAARVVILIGLSIFGLAAGAATISTDKKDYFLGSTAIITGSGFAAGESVQVQVLHADDRVDTNADHEPWLVTADPGGA